MAPMGPRLRPLCQEDRSPALGGPGGPRSAGLEQGFRAFCGRDVGLVGHHTWARGGAGAGLPLMLGPCLPSLPGAWGTPMLRSGAGAGPGAAPGLTPAGLGAQCPLRPWAPASGHCEENRGHWGATHPFPSPRTPSLPPSKLGTYLGRAGLCSSASPPGRCWAGGADTEGRGSSSVPPQTLTLHPPHCLSPPLILMIDPQCSPRQCPISQLSSASPSCSLSHLVGPLRVTSRCLLLTKDYRYPGANCVVRWVVNAISVTPPAQAPPAQTPLAPEHTPSPCRHTGLASASSPIRHGSWCLPTSAPGLWGANVTIRGDSGELKSMG